MFFYLPHDDNRQLIASMAAFSFAAVIGFATLIGLPNLRPNSSSTHRPLLFLLLALLALFLHDGLLTSLKQVFSLPVALAFVLSASLVLFALLAFYRAAIHTYQNKQTMPWCMFCIGAIAYCVLLRLCYMGTFELIFEEAYYWNYAQHLDIGYLDHPLITAWIIKLFTAILGDTEIAVRMGAFLCWFITAYFIYKLTLAVFDRLTALTSTLLIAILPAYFSFGYFMSPDAPLTACWAAAAYFAYRIFSQHDAKAWMWLGVALGLGMSSKYTIALLGGAIVLFMLFDKNARSWLLRKEPYITLIIVCALFSPVIIWNLQHHWASFTFQSQGRLESGHHFSLPRFISNLLIFLTPTGFLSVIAIVLNRKQITISMGNARNWLILAWLALFPVAVFASLSLIRASKLNWTGPCWLPLIPFLAWLLTHRPTQSKLLQWCHRAWPATVIILLLGYGAGLHYLAIGFPWVKYPQNTHLLGWRAFGGEIERIKAQLEHDSGEKILVVGMDRNKIASGLAFYRSQYLDQSGESKTIDPQPAFDTASEHLFGAIGLMYEWWFPVEEQVGKTMLLVGESVEDVSGAAVKARTQSQSEVKSINTLKNSQQTGQYYYCLVKGYHR
jgi:dolichol-phosphate mannosyltransferase